MDRPEVVSESAGANEESKELLASPIGIPLLEDFLEGESAEVFKEIKVSL